MTSTSPLQTATFGDGRWWFGCYGSVLIRCEADLSTFTEFVFNASDGLEALGRWARSEVGAPSHWGVVS